MEDRCFFILWKVHSYLTDCNEIVSYSECFNKMTLNISFQMKANWKGLLHRFDENNNTTTNTILLLIDLVKKIFSLQSAFRTTWTATGDFYLEIQPKVRKLNVYLIEVYLIW